MLVTMQEKVPRSSREGLLKIALDLETRTRGNKTRYEVKKNVAVERDGQSGHFKDTYLPPSLTIVRREVSVIAL